MRESRLCDRTRPDSSRMPYSPLEEEEKEDALEDSFVQRWLSELVPDFVTENVFW